MLPKNHSDRAIWLVIFIIFIFLAGNFIFTQYEFSHLKNTNVIFRENTVSSTESSPVPDSCGPACQDYIRETVKNYLPAQAGNLTVNPTVTPTPTTKATSAPTAAPLKITYIPLISGSTQSTDWVTISGSGFTLNFADYGSRAYATWDANLRVDNANGATFARLFDTTHSIAVNGSEISITNISTSTDVISGSLSFWRGNNNYVIQLKSLNGSTAFMDSGRIKINY